MRNCILIVVFFFLFGLGKTDATRRALVFGLGKQLDKRWGVIHGDNDVDYVVSMLQTMGYTDIEILKNEKATKLAMVRAFEKMVARCRKGDVVYVHYSGHGQLMTDLNGDEARKWKGPHAQWDESWIPYDAYMVYGKEDHGEKHFCDDEVALYLQKIRNKITASGQLVVAIDACHSGDATCGQEDEYVRGVDLKFNIPRPQSPPSPLKPIREQWMTISACRPYQLSSEVRKIQVGKLTYALFSIGRQWDKMSNRQLEKNISEVYNRCPGRLKQSPMVTGVK